MKTSTAVTLAGATVASGVLAYALYFDYKRRNDTDFRKKLRKEKKRIDKQASQSKTEDVTASSPTQEQLRAALAKLQEEGLPSSQQEKEHYFMTQVGLGEQLTAQGPTYNLPAALAFYRALRVYPSPVELIVLYEKSVTPAVFKIVMELMSLDAEKKATGYYDAFPPTSMNVKVKHFTEPIDRKALLAEKDFKEGDVIYTEFPMVSVLDPDLQSSGTHCSHCLRTVEVENAVIPSFDRLDSIFCSAECETKCKFQAQNLLFGREPIIPIELNPTAAIPGAQEMRNAAQVELAAFVKSATKSGPLLVARYAGRQVDNEVSKLIPDVARAGRLVDPLPSAAASGDYTLGDYMERLRFIDTEVSEHEQKLLSNVLQTSLPGLEVFIEGDRYSIIRGKMRYNAIGIFYDGGRDDKPVSTERPEDVEKTRTPVGTQRQIGSGLFQVSSYLAHSCSPSTRVSFNGGNHELHLIATRDIKKGDELTMAYVDVTQQPEETVDEVRRRRRQELARGWKFACTCELCLADKPVVVETEDLGVTKDESKMEEAVARVEANMS